MFYCVWPTNFTGYNIWNHSLFLEFKFWNTDPPFGNPPFSSSEAPLSWAPGTHKHWRSGKRSGILVWLKWHADRPPLRSLLPVNVQFLENKLYELWARILFQRLHDLAYRYLTVRQDTRLHYSTGVLDRSRELTGKTRGGGVCFMNNNSWCDSVKVHPIKSFCSPSLEYLMLVSAILITEGIYSSHYCGCWHSLFTADYILFNTQGEWFPSWTHTNPFYMVHLNNQITIPSYSYPPTGRSWNRKLQHSCWCFTWQTIQIPR